ncbi:Uncharacterised protein [Achromobacter xylosoxidans]|nr:Uncharacterised protein [Achromobacter xylosoxidans]
MAQAPPDAAPSGGSFMRVPALAAGPADDQPCTQESRKVTMRFSTGFSAVDSLMSAVK